MSASFLLRRIHLYLGLALFPWVIMYGLSSISFAHSVYLNKRDAAKNLPGWYLRFERAYDAPVPSDPAALLDFGVKLTRDIGVTARNVSAVRMNATTINVGAYSFLQATRILYYPAEKRLTVEDRRFRFQTFLAVLHSRTDFPAGGFLQKLWGVFVDAAAVSFVLWIVTGLVLWWSVPAPHRTWGWVALLAGLGSFLLFAFGL